MSVYERVSCVICVLCIRNGEKESEEERVVVRVLCLYVK